MLIRLKSFANLGVQVCKLHASTWKHCRQKFLSRYVNCMLALGNIVERSFCPTGIHSHSVSNKHTEVYINYKPFGLFRHITYYFLQLKLTHNSYLCLATWLGTFSQQGIPILLPLLLDDNCVSAFPLPRILLVWSPCLYFLPGYCRPIRILLKQHE